ncbi:MAG: helix-turn-helix transcriptional regulator [Thermoleophilaceae bacterium]|nr:helix-turn-helix transcriptional regulator [Thermoleophilaceae bacterium]
MPSSPATTVRLSASSSTWRSSRPVIGREQRKSTSWVPAHEPGAKPYATASSPPARRAGGAKSRSTALSGVESLTSSERRVAAVAAESMGNREIAQALFVTLRTVHASGQAFRKLHISSRMQLVDALAEEGRCPIAS